jgi:hypothetical protein
MRSGRILGLAAAIGSLLLCVSAAQGGTSSTPLSLPPLSSLGGGVDVAISGTTEYLSGSDYWLGGTVTGGFAELHSDGSLVSGRPTLSFDSGFGVSAAASDGAGGWFLGTSAEVSNGLVHVDAAGNLVSSFNAGSNGSILALVYSGSTVFAAGTCVAGTYPDCSAIAAFDTSTGATKWTAQVTWSGGGFEMAHAAALAVAGSTLYVGGHFDSVDGDSRAGLAALDTATGTPTSWNPQISLSGTSHRVSADALAVSGSTVYAGGEFDTVNGSVPRNGLAAFDATTGTATAFDPDLTLSFGGPAVASALLVSGSTVYAAGEFDTVNGSTVRDNIAAFDAATGAATAWDPSFLNSVITTLALSGSKLYVGGSGLSTEGEGNDIVAVDAATAVASDFSPQVGGNVDAVAVSGSDVFVGGSFRTIGGSARTGVASIDLATGQPTALEIPYSGKFAVSGSTVYVVVGDGLRAFDSGSGDQLWTVSTDGEVSAVAVSASTVYMGGAFTTVTPSGGSATPTAGLAAFDAASGSLVTGWAPGGVSVSGGTATIEALAVSGASVYVGGTFDTAGGATRHNLAAFSASTGALSAWNPNIAFGSSTPSVNALAVLGSTVYAGGNFDTVNGSTARSFAAAFDDTTGMATKWNPNHDSTVNALVAVGSTVYMGDAAYDTLVGIEKHWSPDLLGPTSVAATSSYVALGGPWSPYNEVFPVTSGTPPTLASVQPTSGAPGTSVTLTGTGFTGADGVAFNGKPALSVTVNSPTRITAVVPDGATTGPVTVVTDDGDATSTSSFVVDAALPLIAGFTPAAGTRGSSVTISGSNFTGATVVAFNGSPAQTFSVDSDGQIIVVVPPAATTGPISVTTSGGTSTSAAPFTVYVPPTVGSVAPTSAGVHSTITVTGTNFIGVTSVKLNGMSAAYSVVSQTTLVFTVPQGATSGTVTVTTPGGTATSGSSVTVLPLPTITGFTPGSGSIGTSVTVTGANLQGVVGVEIGSIVTVPISVAQDGSQITFTIPIGAQSGPIRVLASNGTATSTTGFVVTS